MAEIRTAYNNIVPNLMGIRLASRIKEDVYRDMMGKLKEASSLEAGRIEALIIIPGRKWTHLPVALTHPSRRA
jgi:hypothetical protein